MIKRRYAHAGRHRLRSTALHYEYATGKYPERRLSYFWTGRLPPAFYLKCSGSFLFVSRSRLKCLGERPERPSAFDPWTERLSAHAAGRRAVAIVHAGCKRSNCSRRDTFSGVPVFVAVREAQTNRFGQSRCSTNRPSRTKTTFLSPFRYCHRSRFHLFCLACYL